MHTYKIEDTIRYMRWFMGKSRPIKSIQEFDSTQIGGTRLIILNVSFADGTIDKYATIENENLIGNVLENAFTSNSLKKIFPSKRGSFTFKVYKNIPQGSLQNTKPLDYEQSNSSFFVPGHYFFKLYRRLQAGIHPETEIMKKFTESGLNITPELLGECFYKTKIGETFSIGILEKLIPNATSAWDVFCNKMDKNKAFELGIVSAKMHKVLHQVAGTKETFDEPPFNKLEQLLDVNKSKEAKDLMISLPKLRKKYTQTLAISKANTNTILAPQRIHGDFHLGQILLETSDNDSLSFKIIDFEGEPTRPIDYRRRLLSPAVDIAGMLRSFRYASAYSKQKSIDVENSFLMGYAFVAKIPTQTLKTVCLPYILSKAIYEACYELEFRPNWFHIPATALLNDF